MTTDRYIVRRAANAWEVIDTTTDEPVATFDVFNKRLAEIDAAARNRYEPGWVYRSGEPAPYRKERDA